MGEKIKLAIDLEEDFDGIKLELAIKKLKRGETTDAEEVLVRLYNIWVKKIGHKEWAIDEASA